MALVVNVASAARSLPQVGQPRVAARVNDFVARLVRLRGPYPWHTHRRDDELFYVVRGRLRIRLRGRTLELGRGDMAVVPKGAEHRPEADRECHVLVFERATVRRRGDPAPRRRPARR